MTTCIPDRNRFHKFHANYGFRQKQLNKQKERGKKEEEENERKKAKIDELEGMDIIGDKSLNRKCETFLTCRCRYYFGGPLAAHKLTAIVPLWALSGVLWRLEEWVYV